jgi:sensor histidine kinase YesM
MNQKRFNWFDLMFSDDPAHRVMRHIVFWLLWWAYFTFTYDYYLQVGLQKIEFTSLSAVLLLETFLLIVVHMVPCYSFIYFLLPRFLVTRNYLFIVIGTVLLIVFLLVAGYFLHANLFSDLDPGYRNKLSSTGNTVWWISINSVLLTAVKIISAATVIALGKRWYLKLKEEGRILNEKFLTDLKLLRAQVRPELLFSSLDHIYKYANNKSPKAQELLLQFSDLLSYLLYECDEAMVDLERELMMMKAYMELGKMRFNGDLEIEVDIKGDKGKRSIAPLLLLPFIENGFRQCILASDQPWINLELSIDGNMLTMKMMNGVALDNAEPEGFPEEINSARKRLELLYPGDHELKMYTELEIYVTVLKITLVNRPGPVLTGSSEIVDLQELNVNYAYR